MDAKRLVLVGLFMACASACGSLLGVDKDYVERSVEASDGDAGTSDATTTTSDGSAGDAGGGVACGGHICQGVCFEGDDCSTCASGSLYCGATHTCMSDCAKCSEALLGAPMTDCWSCTSPSARRGSCEPTTTAYCLQTGYPHCACDGANGSCPGSQHVCVANQCENCGTASANTDGQSCSRRGYTCEASKKRCAD